MAAFVAAISIPATVFALSDGAYTVGRTTSYVNPETGVTADGGTNIALGDSMCASIVDTTALVEQYQGNTYVTLGIGLMSNISSVKFQVQGADGSYKDVSATLTGSCTRNGDTCNHYRFQVTSADLYISPILYVTPMGREVQFYVKLDMASAAAGTGNYVSEMIPAASSGENASSSAGTATGNTSSQSSSSSGSDSVASGTGSAQNTHDNTAQTEGNSAGTTGNSEAVSEENQVEATEGTEAVTEESSEFLHTETTETTEPTEAVSTKAKHAHTGLSITVLLVILVAAGGVGYWLYRKKRDTKV